MLFKKTSYSIMEYFSITNTSIELPYILAYNFKSREVLDKFETFVLDEIKVIQNFGSCYKWQRIMVWK